MADMQNVTWPGWETVRLIERDCYGSVYEIQRNTADGTERAVLKVIPIPPHPDYFDDLRQEGYSDEDIIRAIQDNQIKIMEKYSLLQKLNQQANTVLYDTVRCVQHDNGMGWTILAKMELLTPLYRSLPTNISETVVINLARDMCSALISCKNLGVVHGNITPHSIFVSECETYKLGNFDNYEFYGTIFHAPRGLFRYAAPEVYNNQPYDGAAADIYSLGLVLYWMLNERRMPFLPLPPEKLKPEMEMIARSRLFSGETISAPAHGSEELKQIVLKACAYDPKDRISPEEMLAQLDSLTPSKELFPVADVLKSPPRSPDSSAKVASSERDNNQEKKQTLHQDGMNKDESRGMEPFVQALYDRLEGKKELQLQFYVIMQNAINEMHNNGIIASLTGEAAKAAHDPNPDVRVREKTRIAKAVGKQFVSTTMPLPSQDGLSYRAVLNYDPRFVNAITLCFQGGIEGLHMTRVARPNMNLDKYIIEVVANGQNLAPLIKNMEQLDQMYDDISIVMICDGMVVYTQVQNTVPEAKPTPTQQNVDKAECKPQSDVSNKSGGKTIERKILWHSGCFDEIDLVYCKAAENEITAKIMSDLEAGALKEAKAHSGLIMMQNQPVTPEQYDGLPDSVKEQFIATLSNVGLSSFSAPLTEPKIIVQLSPQIQQLRCCTAFSILNRLEKLDGALNMLHPHVTLELQAPLGCKQCLVELETLICLLYPWLNVKESGPNLFANDASTSLTGKPQSEDLIEKNRKDEPKSEKSVFAGQDETLQEQTKDITCARECTVRNSARKFVFSNKRLACLLIAAVLLVVGISFHSTITTLTKKIEETKAEHEASIAQMIAEEDAKLEQALAGPPSMNEIAWDMIVEGGPYRIQYSTITGPYAMGTSTLQYYPYDPVILSTYYYILSYIEASGEEVYLSLEFGSPNVEQIALLGEELYVVASLTADKATTTLSDSKDIGELFKTVQPNGKDIYLHVAYDSRDEYVEAMQQQHDTTVSSFSESEELAFVEGELNSTNRTVKFCYVAAAVFAVIAVLPLLKKRR